MLFKTKTYMMKLSLLVLFLKEGLILPRLASNSICSQGQPELLTLLPPSFKCWDCRHILLPQLGSKPLFKKLTKRDREQTCNLVEFWGRNLKQGLEVQRGMDSLVIMEGGKAILGSPGTACQQGLTGGQVGDVDTGKGRLLSVLVIQATQQDFILQYGKPLTTFF